jgi:hypothetical protein
MKLFSLKRSFKMKPKKIIQLKPMISRVMSRYKSMRTKRWKRHTRKMLLKRKNPQCNSLLR